ncbi:unnamed protein product [Adineta ricciae]|uniref:Uncharacterized protein n=1 Tax=Adineta ricciae TaxID=249248 RepID=A0A815B9I6_ADIRI|nr:unnamed protein product [Adineta ricciae]CAF1534144.1 unnamed protein product [Adineta ricciae]
MSQLATPSTRILLLTFINLIDSILFIFLDYGKCRREKSTDRNSRSSSIQSQQSTEAQLQTEIRAVREILAEIRHHLIPHNPESSPTTKIQHHTPLTTTLSTPTIVVPPISNLPETWDEFTTQFLAQFHLPICISQQENETINEFVVCLRSLWLEQKPDEKETDFIKHLLCKMKPDMLAVMNANRPQTLSNIITEAQQVEEILYLRDKEERRCANERSKLAANTPLLTLSTNNQYSARNTPNTSPFSFTPTCWRCYETGHYAIICPLNKTRRTFEVTDNLQQPLPQRAKKQLRSFREAGTQNSYHPNPQSPKMSYVNTIDSSHNHPLIIHGRIGALPITFLVDTSFTLTLINLQTFNCLSPRLIQSRYKPPSSITTHGRSFTTYYKMGYKLQQIEKPDLSKSILDEHQQQQLSKVLQAFPQLFTNTSGRTNVIKHHIDIQPGSRPCNSPPYRYAPARRKIIKEELSKMLNDGIIIPSKNYRKLNNITIRDAYPLPRIDDTLDSLQQAQFFSMLDLRSDYWQVEMDENSKPITAFVTHRGLLECTVMPFGLTNAPATFQRLMDIVLSGLKWQCCLVYLDDILYFLQRHLVTPEGIKPDPTLVDTVVEAKQQVTIRDVQAFLGLTGYYRRFIKHCAQMSEPHLKLLRCNQNSTSCYLIQWNDDCTTVFNTLKQRLVSSPMMQLPNFSYPFILELDACEYGVGRVLTREYNKHKSVIAYMQARHSTQSNAWLS